MPEDPAPTYFLDGNEYDAELARLKLLERLAGSWTARSLEQLGDLSGKRCLEVGAGGGGVTRWLADAVGPSGSVVAVDRDPRFLTDLPAHVEVREADLNEFEPDGPFDVVHARAVLVYVAGRHELLQRLTAALAPGGWMALEEPIVVMTGEFINRYDGQERPDAGAIMQLLELSGADVVRFPLRLPVTFDELGFTDTTWDLHIEASRGGDDRWARFNEWTVADVAAPLAVAFDLASEDLPENIRAMLRDPAEVTLSPMLMTIRGRRP